MTSPSVQSNQFSRFQQMNKYIMDVRGLANTMIVFGGVSKFIAAYVPKHKESALGFNDGFRVFSVLGDICDVAEGVSKLSEKQVVLGLHKTLYHGVRTLELFVEWKKLTALDSPVVKDCLEITKRFGAILGFGHYLEQTRKDFLDIPKIEDVSTKVKVCEKVRGTVLNQPDVEMTASREQSWKRAQCLESFFRAVTFLISAMNMPWKHATENLVLASRVATALANMSYFHVEHEAYNDANPVDKKGNPIATLSGS
ncbi:MAG: hypothetical protein K940chlam8_00270 [Chlamydiae bacterium]|nr:hypothetical protein [Chlamydiota bacterium]